MKSTALTTRTFALPSPRNVYLRPALMASRSGLVIIWMPLGDPSGLVSWRSFWVSSLALNSLNASDSFSRTGGSCMSSPSIRMRKPCRVCSGRT
ncbi:hypothetical protein D3C85_646100 [compost metagenome]